MNLRWRLFTVLCSLFTILLFLLPRPAEALCFISDSCTGGVSVDFQLPTNDRYTGEQIPYPNAECTNPGASPETTYTLCCRADTEEEARNRGHNASAAENASNWYANKNPICGSSPEVTPTCADCGGSLYCFGRDFALGDTDPAFFSPDNNGNVNVDPRGFTFNGKTFSGENVQVTGSNTTPEGCTPIYDFAQPKDSGSGAPPACTLPRLDEPHPLRPNPGASCIEEPDPAGRLSCAADLQMNHVIDDPFGSPLPFCGPGAAIAEGARDLRGQPHNAKVEVSEKTGFKDDGRPYTYYQCDYSYTRVIEDIEFTPVIDHSRLDLPIAGLASRGCESGVCLADTVPPVTLMNNYTSWYHQGAVYDEGLEIPQDPSQAPIQIPANLGQQLADYMNALIDADLPANVKLLSPAFDVANSATPGIFAQMEQAGAKFGQLDGFAGNAYTAAGKLAMDWYGEFMAGKVAQYGKPMILTEFGDFRLGEGGDRPTIINQMAAEFRRTGGIAGVLYFNAFGGNGEFSGHRLSDAEIQTITASAPARGGVNSALGVDGGGNFAAQVGGLGLGWSLEIAYGANQSDVDAVISAFNTAISAGVKPILRICSGNSCDFADSQTYIDFLRQVAAGVNGEFWAIAGPNEPDKELWLSGLQNGSQLQDMGDIPETDWLTLMGPIRKLIPEEVLNQRKKDIIVEVAAGTAYDQFIDRQKTVRISDMANHIDPAAGDEPWYTLWNLYMPFTMNNDIGGRVFTTVSGRESSEFKDPKLVIANPNYDVYFPHNRELDNASQLLQAIFKPEELAETSDFRETRISQADYDKLEGRTSYRVAPGKPWAKTVEGGDVPEAPYDTNLCNLVALSNAGDRLHDAKLADSPAGRRERTITGRLYVSKPVEFRHTTRSDIPNPDPPRGLSVGTVSIYIQNPVETDSVWDRLVRGPTAIFRALFPEGILEETDYPAESSLVKTGGGLSYFCGPDCQVLPGGQALGGTGPEGPVPAAAYFPHWGTVLNDFHYNLQKLFNPIPGGGPQAGSTPGQNTAILGTDYLTSNYPASLLRQMIIPSAEKIAAFLEKIKIWQTQPGNTWAGSRFEQNYQKIIDFGLANNLNPTLLLALYLEESHGEAAGAYPMGCGSATTLDASLDCLAHDPAIDAYRDADLAEFMCRYADGHYPCDYAAHPNFIKNLFDFYNQLAP